MDVKLPSRCPGCDCDCWHLCVFCCGQWGTETRGQVSTVVTGQLLAAASCQNHPPPRAGDGNSRVASACLNITDGLKPPFGYDLCGQESQFHIYLLCLNAHLAYYFIICGSASRGPSPSTVKFLKVLLTLIASPPPPPRQQLCPDADFIKLIKFWAVGSSQGGARAGGVWEESHLLFTFTARR